ncbi:CE1758 family FMN-dependent luciferase-like monooxygenase [Mangrovihabitans endophyticus]|uniref:Oxidoreductase n=1 Tax=Mangrovihabitans endophyticus TaxID=1751298 RepID=A0A8J3FMD8_9ACTN|nr:CE1758 family FMN-dependent luciferase-like monooxygenase [Mangrovihabitans endophyticus]GGK78644.1 oxidoreductase [Mangrovihabitans endophyticus]
MQFGVYSVGDCRPDPVTGRSPGGRERIAGLLRIAHAAEQSGFDVFALGEHHTPPYAVSSPVPVLAHLAATTHTVTLSTATTLVTTNDPVRLAEDYATLQLLANGRMDVMLGRGVDLNGYRLFGRNPEDGARLAAENYDLLRRLWDEQPVTWQGSFRSPVDSVTSTPRPLDGTPPFVWHGSTHSRETAELAAMHGDGFFAMNSFWPREHTRRIVAVFRDRYAHHGHGSADQAVVGLGGHVFVRANSQDAVRDFRPYFHASSGYGGASLDEAMASAPLVVGSPQQVIDGVLGFREYAGDYQRQLFAIDHGGLPLAVVLEQIDMLGADVLPVLRRETGGPAGDGSLRRGSSHVGTG